MDYEKTLKYWVETSDYDIVTAEAMLQTKRFLYVGFVCHLATEKILKGYYAHLYNEVPPYIHDLVRLAKEDKLLELMNEEQKDLLNLLMPMNIQARYPSYKEELLKQLNYEVCRELINRTKEFILWVKTKL